MLMCLSEWSGFSQADLLDTFTILAQLLLGHSYILGKRNKHTSYLCNPIQNLTKFK